MHTFLGRRLSLDPEPSPGRSQAGFLLIEVLISSVLVAMIAVATFTGFQAATKSAATDRTRVFATQLVAQKQEELRSLTTTELERYGTQVKGPEEICAGGNKEGSKTKKCPNFTITSTATFVAASSKQFTCETSGTGANYIQITTEATWTGEQTHDKHPVRQTSIVTVPPTASVEVKVKDEDSNPVEGATVELREEGKSPGTTQITPASGCVIFSALTSGQKETILVKKSGWETPAGEEQPSKEATVTTGTVTLQEFVIAPTGELAVKFTTGGVSSEGDTFVAYQAGIKPDPFYVGGTAGTFKPAVTLAGLYPFAILKEKVWEPEKYIVYAGDCTANSPETVAKVKPPEQSVLPAKASEVTVERPAVNVIVYQATKAAVKKLEEEKKVPTVMTTAESLKIINPACKGILAQNYTGGVKYEHSLVTPGGLNAKGELLQKGQPYAKELQLCVAVTTGKEKFYKTTTPVVIANTSSAGSAVAKIYMEEQTKTTKLVSC